MEAAPCPSPRGDAHVVCSQVEIRHRDLPQQPIQHPLAYPRCQLAHAVVALVAHQMPPSGHATHPMNVVVCVVGSGVNGRKWFTGVSNHCDAAGKPTVPTVWFGVCHGAACEVYFQPSCSSARQATLPMAATWGIHTQREGGWCQLSKGQEVYTSC